MRNTLAIAAAIVIASIAHAHDWYDFACCGGTHCHPVADGVVIENASGVVVNGFGVLNYSDPRLHWSRDDRDHICVADGKLLCVYRKPKDM